MTDEFHEQFRHDQLTEHQAKGGQTAMDELRRRMEIAEGYVWNAGRDLWVGNRKQRRKQAAASQ